MRVYKVDPAVFEMFPEFRRGVVVAAGINNEGSCPVVAEALAQSIVRASAASPSRGLESIAVWNDAYRRFGVDPDKHTPSIRFLYEQIRREKPPRSISKVVDIMNATSLEWITPCGGDDLGILNGGDLCLGFADGSETFAPLFKPAAIDHPNPGEVIYYTPQTGRVMCRRWTWRNADFSKITADTKVCAINIDMLMPPLSELDLEDAVIRVKNLIKQSCGGTVEDFILSAANPVAQIGL